VQNVKWLRAPFAGRTLINNVVALTSLQGLTYVFPVILVPYLARVLGPTAWALVVFCQAFAGCLQIVVEYGFQLSATRELAAHRDSRETCGAILTEVTATKLVLLSVAGAAVYVASPFLSHLSTRPLLLWSGMIWMAGQALNMAWFFQGIERLKTAVVADVAAAVISTTAILCFVHRPDEGWKVLLFQGCASITTAAYALYRAATYSVVVRPVWPRIFARLWSGRHAFGYRLALSAYSTANPVLLGWMAPVLAVGYFSGADKIARALLVLVYPIAQALYPRVNYHRKLNSDKAARLAGIGLMVSGSLGVGSGILAFVAAPEIVRFLLGPKFIPAIELLQVLALICPLISVNTVLVYHWLLPRFLDAALTGVTVTAGFFNVCMAVLLVPRYGALGMAWAVVAAEAMVTASCGLILMYGSLRGNRKPVAHD
jgi:PST family polysaccharide transporter